MEDCLGKDMLETLFMGSVRTTIMRPNVVIA